MQPLKSEREPQGIKMLREWVLGAQVLVLDPEREYRYWAQMVEGTLRTTSEDVLAELRAGSSTVLPTSPRSR